MNATLKNNSFYSILLNPTNAFEAILSKKNRHLILLIIIGSVWYSVVTTMSYQENVYLRSSFIMSTVTMLVAGWLILYLYAFAIRFFTRIQGGKSSVKETYAVIAWSFAPFIIALFINLITVLIFGEAVLKNSTAISSLSTIRFGLLAINGLFVLWYLYILIKGIAYSSSISITKSISAIVLSTLALMSFVYLFSLVLRILITS